MAGGAEECGIPSASEGRPHVDPGQSWVTSAGACGEGLPPGGRAVRRCQADGITHEPRRGQVGTIPERTAWQRIARPETHEQETAGQPAGDGTGRHQPGDRVRVHTEVLGVRRAGTGGVPGGVRVRVAGLAGNAGPGSER